ncbi:hypothetical protein AADZ90_007010 [Aestuariibius sp. 2305UL40-4]|uniref:hypothetical protein n=1 Tax=Aestuariibius violaceus TaxID=3234132 RepID=UPI00345E9141
MFGFVVDFLPIREQANGAPVGFVFPLSLMLQVGLSDGSGFSMSPAIEILSSSSVPRAH